MRFTEYTEGKFLEAAFKGTAFSITTLYAALFSGDPSDGGTELTNTITGSNNRIGVTSSMGTVTSVSGHASISNTSEITIVSGATNSNPVTATYVGYYDAITGGNLIGYDQLPDTGSVIVQGIEVRIPVSGFTGAFKDAAAA